MQANLIIYQCEKSNGVPTCCRSLMSCVVMHWNQGLSSLMTSTLGKRRVQPVRNLSLTMISAALIWGQQLKKVRCIMKEKESFRGQMKVIYKELNAVLFNSIIQINMLLQKSTTGN